MRSLSKLAFIGDESTDALYDVDTLKFLYSATYNFVLILHQIIPKYNLIFKKNLNLLQ